MSQEQKFEAIAEMSQRILDAYGGYETSDSSRVMYTAGDLNIARDGGVVEIIFRGTLAFRYAPEGDRDDRVFEEHGVWLEEVERIARTVPESPSAGNAA